MFGALRIKKPILGIGIIYFFSQRAPITIKLGKHIIHMKDPLLGFFQIKRCIWYEASMQTPSIDIILVNLYLLMLLYE